MNTFGKILLSFAVLFTFSHVTQAQQKFGNEWIDPAKTYFKIKVAQNGIYKVTYEELTAAGFPQSGIQGTALKLINFGNEQAIFVSDNDFGANDYIEFYGEKNTIGLDSLLFDDWQKDLFNPEYSFVSDTNAYFLTISPETSNLRYTLVNPDYNNITLTPFPYYQHTEKVVYSGSFFKNVDGDIRYSQFEPSEGFGSGLQQASTTSLNASLLVETGPAPVLKFRTGQNNHVSNLEISWNNQLKDTKLTNPRLTTQHTYTLDKSEIKATNTLNLKNIQSTNDRHTIAYVSLKYPRAFDFGNKSEYNFDLPSATGKRLLDITAFKSDNQPVYVFDISNKIRYSTKINSGKVQVIVNPTSAESGYYMIAENDGSRKVSGISVFKPRSYAYTGQQYILISNKSLYETGPNYVKDYADYRSSSIGGNYKTEILEIQDLYDHFGYGIDRHFVSVKNWAGFAKKNWKEAKFAMVLGKAIEYPYMRTSNDVINNVDRVFFVPTFGYPGSDNMLLSEKNFPDPYFAIGRLAARTPDEIRNYLDKVKLYEQALKSEQSIEAKYWTKRVMHLGGGKNDFEQTAIQNGLDNMASLLKDTIYGADVKSYFKNTYDAVQFSVNEEITHLFEDGVSLINFFGHSGSTTWDFSIQNPRNYNNYGKYPLINSFGCYSGNLHGVGKGISESFVLEKDKGSISFLASSGTAFISSLSSYGYRFYDTWLNKLRYRTVGEVITYLANQSRNSQFAELALYAQLTYHGDPAIKLYLEKLPDYLFEEKSVRTIPSTVQASAVDYKIELNIANLGIYRLDSVDVQFLHFLPDGKVADTIKLRLPGIANMHKVILDLKNYGPKSVGNNTLVAKIDPENKISEGPLPAAENNNNLVINGVQGFEFYVTDNVATAIYPPDFAMINTPDHMILKASTGSVPLAKGSYVFQIDTTAYFNSPLLETSKVESTGGLITYKPSLPAVPDRVYYWRVSPDSTSAEGYKWSSASFAFLPDEAEGWNQSHFFQFTQNEFTDLEISEDSKRKFEFGQEIFSIKIRNKIWDPSDVPGYFVNNIRWGAVIPWNFMESGLGFVINVKSDYIGGILNPPGGLYGSLNPTSDNLRGFFFKTETLNDRKNIIEFLEKEFTDNTYLNVFTILRNPNSKLNANEWAADSIVLGRNLFSVLESFGANKIRNLTSKSVPYILQVENGKGVINEDIGSSIDDIAETTMLVSRNLQHGLCRSNYINKVKKIKKAIFTIGELNEYKNYSVAITKKDSQNIENVLLNGLQNLDSPVDLISLNLNSLHLKLEISDSTNRKAPQLNFWRVSYDPLPDAAITFVKSEPNLSNNEVNQGEKVKIFYNVTSVNFVAMDSILVKFSYTDNNNQVISAYRKLGKLNAGQMLSDAIEFPIPAGTTSEIRFIIAINPDNNQPELNHFNNVLTKLFNVSRDKDNPLLDVYFDGIKIMDGDIVSPKPEILITLEDDNTFLPVTDPNLFEIKLDTGRNQIIEIPMDSPQIKFSPASATNPTAKVQYYPTLKDGDYRLVVQGKDVTGNKSGINARNINFKVIEKQSVSNVLNYPNPFSTSTQFVFTLTGAEVPDIMSISILTLTGKVVREITKEQLGNLRIGVNRTDYRWDGTDEFGSKLANGVYLYKVNTRKKGGDKYDNYTNAKADVFFKEGFGKMVILR